MRVDAIWCEDGYYRAPDPIKKSSNIKLDITKCEIEGSPEGFINLMLNGKKVKRLNHIEYIRLRAYVKQDNYRGLYCV